MKNILLFLFAGLFFLNVSAQTDADTDAFINKCIVQVNNIDDQILYKAQIDYSGYRLGPNDYVNELLTVLYFDINGILKKSYFIFSLEVSGIGYYVRYFDNNGDLICSILNGSFGPAGRCSAVRYVSQNDKLMHVDFVSLHNENLGIWSERILRTGRPSFPLPMLDGESYDSVSNIEDLIGENKRLFNIDSIYLPNKLSPVRFVMPQTGDTTYVRGNAVPIYRELGKNIVKYIDICDVVILETHKDWYKIKILECGNIGYINADFLTPVEKGQNK